MPDEQPPRKPARWWVRVLRSAGLAIGISVMLLIIVAMGFGDSFIFFPQKADGEWDLNRRAAGAEEVELRAADGAKLVCWHVRAKDARATVVFFHGNAGNLSHRAEILSALERLEVDVLIVGYHGYGKSDGKPGEAALYQDADAAYAFLTEQRKVPSSRIVLFGESLGGGPAIDLASRKPVAGVIVQSGFTSIADMAAQAIPFFPTGWLMSSKIDNLSKIPKVVAPKLFFATKTDEVVPYAQTRRLFEAAVEPKTWVEFEGCGHNDLFWTKRREWSGAIRTFLDQAAPRR
jgi:hypothetical protein